jgi:multiple sugar transport system ATP-binding protein
MSGVTFDNIKKVYSSSEGNIVAVEDFSVDVRDGEFLVLVGPSGCGKSTTLRMVPV